MRKVEFRKRFRRDFKRKLGGRYYNVIVKPGGELWEVVDALAENMPLLYVYHDHALQGEYEGCRECHIRPDLLLVYRYVGDDVLMLERLGSHAELFGM